MQNPSTFWSFFRDAYGIFGNNPPMRWTQAMIVRLLSGMSIKGNARLRTGDRLRIDFSNMVGRSIWLRGDYDASIARFLISELKEGEAFLDLGANVGYYTALASRKVGPRGLVVSVEPAPQALMLLAESVAMNSWSNVAICSFAASSRAGLLRFAPSENSALSKVSAEGSISVPAARLDDIVIPLLGNRAIGSVKVDIEGHDLDALEGMTRIFAEHRPRRVVTEVFLEKGPEYTRTLFKFFEDRGYKPVNPVTGGALTPRDMGGQCWNAGFQL